MYFSLLNITAYLEVDFDKGDKFTWIRQARELNNALPPFSFTSKQSLVEQLAQQILADYQKRIK